MKISSARPGMSLVELLFAMGLFTLVIAAAAAALRDETVVFNVGNERLELLQNYRFAVNMLEQDLRVAGSGVAPQQPSMVYAGDDVLAFNADYASRVAGDLSAVFIDPDAPAEAVMALGARRRITIPNTGFRYPDTTFTTGGVNSPAETIIYFFEPDAFTERGDDYRLFRQVNDLEPELLSRNLLQKDGAPFFEYTELVVSDTAPDAMRALPAAVIPLAHRSPAHLAPGDTGAVGRIDWIRAVRINVAATNGRTGEDELIETMSRLIWLPNIRQRQSQMCGDPPLAVLRPAAVGQLNPTSGDPEVHLEWAASVDEGGGEGDVVRYLLWRRLGGSPDWGDPYLSLPAGNTRYTFVDAAVDPGTTYEYAVSAQDCTPALSDQSPGALVAVPVPVP